MEREVFLRAPGGEVWAALTEGDRLSAWFGARVRLEARPGGRATFRWPDGTTRGATVEAVEAERLLILRWLPFADDAEGRRSPQPSTILRFLLRATPDGTRLTVTEHPGAAPGRFPDYVPSELDRRLESRHGGPRARTAG